MTSDTHSWSTCPLDVQGLATDAVEAVKRAVQEVVAVRGQPWEVTTNDSLVLGSFSALENLTVDGRPSQGWASFSGFFETQDGWVRLHGNYPHHAAAITKALGATTRQGLQLSLRKMDAQTVEDLVTFAGGVAAAVRTPGQWEKHPHGRATCNDPWVAVTTAGARRSLEGGDLPLEGIRVIDVTRVIAGPSCSQLLACLGADVLRIDPPGRPELRDQYLSNGMGKRSVIADLSVHRSRLEELLATADVVLLGYRPGSLRRFGLDPDALLSRFSHLVVASLSAWGEHGPWGDRSGFDSIVQAASGIASICSSRSPGPAGLPLPGALPVQALDHATGNVMAAEVIRLLARGTGGLVRINLLGAARTLTARPAPHPGSAIPLATSAVTLASPDGVVRVAPPALMLNGRTLERSLHSYGGDGFDWEVH